MTQEELINKILSELQEGINLAKCRKCGCMKETLEKLLSYFEVVQTEYPTVFKNIEKWLREVEAIKYACLGCEHCYPAVAMNIFNKAFPEAESYALSCAFEVREKTWPVVAGEYFVFCDGIECPVAVSTLASIELAETLAKVRPRGLCIVGKTETENIGIEKIIKNTVTNPTIRVLLLVGKDPEGHYSGRTILALRENGVDEKMRIIGSPAKHPVLRNVSREEVEVFRKQVQVINMIGCEDINTIVDEIERISRQAGVSSCERVKEIKFIELPSVQVIQAQEPNRVEIDKAGYFVIIPQYEKKIIVVEHYSYDNKLLRVIEGKDARSIYWTIIKNGWITQLSHAAYLGKELTRAELSIRLGFKYVQDAQ